MGRCHSLCAMAVVALAVGCAESPTTTVLSPATPAGVPRLIALSGDGQRGEVGTVLAQPLTVKLLDGFGAPITGQVVVFSGTFAHSDSVRTDALGVAALAWRLPERAGADFIDASAVPGPSGGSAIGGASWRATAVAGPPRAIERIGGDNAVVVPLTALDALTVSVTDRYGNSVGGVPVRWSVVAGDGVLQSFETQTDTSGRASTFWTVGARLGKNSVAATAGDDVTTLFTATSNAPFSASSVFAGERHSCALDATGAAWCWGANDFGQLGIGAIDARVRPNPVKVSGGIAFASLAVGQRHTCGVTARGEAFCWGANDVAQLGASAAGPSTPLPVRVAGGLAFAALAAGRGHTCGLTTLGEVFCWGDRSVGQVGSGSQGVQRLPASVTIAEQFTALSAGDDFACALSTAGDAYCWGSDSRHQLGTSGQVRCVVGTAYDEDAQDVVELTAPCSSTPVRVAMSSKLASLVSGPTGSCAATAEVQLICWGNGSASAQVVAGVPLAGPVALGMSTVCGLDRAGAVRGADVSAGAGSAAMGDELSFSSLTGSASHWCGITRGQSAIAYCWGTNNRGQLGDGTTRPRPNPVPVASP